MINKSFHFVHRTIQFEYDKKTTVEGALGYRYKLGEKLVSNETYEEENSCFNPEPVPEQVFISCYFLKCFSDSLPLRKCSIAKSPFNGLKEIFLQ